MSLTDQTIEVEIQAKGLDKAPRITPSDVEAAIESEVYFAAADAIRFSYLTSDPDGMNERLQKNAICNSLSTRTYSGACLDVDANTNVPEQLKRLTVCVLILRNGITVVGIDHGPVSAQNFDSAMGRKMARQKAIDQVWPLLGYELASRLSSTPA